jgi:pimeloyl-ACP methyl ester carboxylesterase
VNVLQANGLSFSYLEWGRAADPLLLLVHGFPDTPHTWNVAGPKLAALGYRVVAPYLRGYAPSAIPPRDTTTKDLGEDVLGWMDALGAKKAVIVGHDWGAEAVTAAVGLQPERVEKLAVVAIPHRTQLPKRPAVAWGARHFVELRLPGALGRFMANDFAMVDALCRRWSPTWPLTAEDTREAKRCFAAPGSANAALGYYRGMTLLTPAFMRARVAVPTLAVAGLHDPLLRPADFERARRHFTGPYEVASIGGGHFCHRESPGAFVEALTRFLLKGSTAT